MRVDLVMWTRDGAATLPHVLERINKVFSSVKKLDESRVFLEQKMRGNDDVC